MKRDKIQMEFKSRPAGANKCEIFPRNSAAFSNYCLSEIGILFSIFLVRQTQCYAQRTQKSSRYKGQYDQLTEVHKKPGNHDVMKIVVISFKELKRTFVHQYQTYGWCTRIETHMPIKCQIYTSLKFNISWAYSYDMNYSKCGNSLVNRIFTEKHLLNGHKIE